MRPFPARSLSLSLETFFHPLALAIISPVSPNAFFVPLCLFTFPLSLRHTLLSPTRKLADLISIKLHCVCPTCTRLHLSIAHIQSYTLPFPFLPFTSDVPDISLLRVRYPLDSVPLSLSHRHGKKSTFRLSRFVLLFEQHSTETRIVAKKLTILSTRQAVKWWRKTVRIRKFDSLICLAFYILLLKSYGCTFDKSVLTTLFASRCVYIDTTDTHKGCTMSLNIRTTRVRNCPTFRHC